MNKFPSDYPILSIKYNKHAFSQNPVYTFWHIAIL